MLCNIGLDTVHLVAYVHTISHCSLMTVFHNQILVKESQGLLGWGGSEAYGKGIEIFKHLAPEVVYRPMTLISHNKIKSLDWNQGIVNNILWLVLPG